MSEKKDNNKFWKSIKDYQDDPEVLESKLHEFKEGVTDDFDPDGMNKFSRRKFLAVLAASSAYAATACTSYRDKGEIVPYVDRPEEILPGKPTYYASTFYDEGLSYGILIKTREGRPIKIEGNPDDKINKGKIPSKTHASILNLYDPERIQEPRKNGRKITWKQANDEIQTILENTSSAGKEIALITYPLTSPSTIKVIDDLKSKFSGLKVYAIQMFNQNNRISAWKQSYNQDVIPAVKWESLDYVLSLESDFLGKEGNVTENKIRFAQGRNIVEKGELNKLAVVEAGMSLTGMNADERLRLKPGLQFNLIRALINELIQTNGINKSKLDPDLINFFSELNLNEFAAQNSLDKSKIKQIADDLISNKGKCIVHGGDILPSETHMLINLLNELLGNEDNYDFENSFLQNQTISSSDEIKELVDGINKNRVGAIIHLESNPIYELAPGLNYATALEKCEEVITLSESPSETASNSKYLLPINNILESWGDHNSRSGQITLQQPVISPLFNTKQKETILLGWISGEEKGDEFYQNYVKENFKKYVYDQDEYAVDYETFWNTALHDGCVNLKSESPAYVKVNQKKIVTAGKTESGINFVVQNNNYFGTGKYSNNGWLQELPHPVTKVTWDNYAAIAPATAKKYELENDDLITIENSGKKIELPVMIQPGMAEDTVISELGYGRTSSGEVANGVGFHIGELLNPDNNSQFIISGCAISKTGEKYKLISTQEHHSLDDEFVKDFHRIRKIIQDGTIDEYKNDPKFLHKHKHDIFSITDSHEYKNEKWAMSIDLNKCLGCSECISSCNVENNVPVVGKDQVELGREMQWMRIDRYYSGTPEEPVVSTQPMLCQHCDNAPCENVCPVNATNHSPDGLNQMAYNRCVGTRYCANNCPYKVRRFNFYNFRDHFEDSYYDNDLSYLVNNPEVTVRSRGVIEKCTFCIQNIMEVRETAIREGREIMPDEVKTSCQSACPTDAIVFGDSNNEKSTVTKHREHDLSYHVLEELNVRPNVTYLAKIRNTHTEDT